MNERPAFSPDRSVLVSDFDGTMTLRDFYWLVQDHLVHPRPRRDYWAEYQAGRLTHFQVLQAIFSEIGITESALWELTHRLELDPELPTAVRDLQAAGWDVVVASAGCQWYIDRLLAEARVEVPVYSNPGWFVPGGGLLMALPTQSPYFSPTHGIDKAAVVRDALVHARRVAFVGDGYPDREAAVLVPDDLRFAKADLARALREKGLPYRPFERWSEVARMLLAET